MRILKEETEIMENIPVSFVTDMMSKGWDEVGYLREASAALKETYKDTAKVEELMQDLMDAYLVFIGQLELYLHNEENIAAPTEETDAKESDDKDEPVEEKEIEKNPVRAPKPELPEADFDIEPLAEPAIPAQANSEFAPAAEVSDPFEFFVDFDEPDMSQPALTDAELYDEKPEEVKRQLRG
jgi:hypothetical protein